jgi:hypothetical protein
MRAEYEMLLYKHRSCWAFKRASLEALDRTKGKSLIIFKKKKKGILTLERLRNKGSYP